MFASLIRGQKWKECKADAYRTIHILIIKTNEMHYFSTLFGKELYMFRTDLLSIIRSLNTVFTAIGICYFHPDLASRQAK
jgi:hypothetical protein